MTKRGRMKNPPCRLRGGSAGPAISDGIFIHRDNAEFGPYSREEVFAALFRGEFGNDDYARQGEDAEWRLLGEVMKAGTPMLFPRVEEISVASYAVELPEYLRGAPKEMAPVGVVREVRSWRSRFESVDFAGILKLGAVGMILSFAVTCFVLKREGLIFTAAVQPAPVHLLATPKPILIAAATPTPKPVAIAVIAATPRPVATPPPVVTAATPAGAPVREVVLPKVNGIDSASLWVANTARNPRAVLVLCLDPGTLPRDAVSDPAWQTFAQDNQLGLAAITFSSDPKLLSTGGGYYVADHGSGDLLLMGLGQAFGKRLPMIVYGQADGAIFATNFAHWRQDSVLMWAAYYTGGWRVQRQMASAPVPALIACDGTAYKPFSPVASFYQDGREQGRPWALLPLAGKPAECEEQMDAFFRQYVPATLSIPPPIGNAGIWADVYSAQTVSSLDLMNDSEPPRTAWLPSPEVQQSWADLIHGHGTVATGPSKIVERIEATRNPMQPSLHMYLRLPPGAVDGKSVSGVLAYCTWQNADAQIVSRLSGETLRKDTVVGPLLKFAAEHNLAVLTWGTVDTWDNTKNTEELGRMEQEQFDRNFELVANAWVRGVQDLGKDTGIPQKDFLLYGISRGAQWAHRLALRRPDYFLAVHLHIPSTFDEPTADANKVLWLLTTGEREYGYERAQQFYHECRALGYPIIFKAIMGLGHSDDTIEHNLGINFFEYALSVKNARDAWEQAANDPFRRSMAPVATTGPWLQAFREPAYYGDFLNQDCYPAQQVDMIPVALRVPLPTKELADLWNK